MQQHTATYCFTLQRTASHCNTLQHTATHYNTPAPSIGGVTFIGIVRYTLCVCMYVHMCVCMCTCVYVCAHVCMYVHMCVCMCTCVYVIYCVWVRAPCDTYIILYIYIYICIFGTNLFCKTCSTLWQEHTFCFANTQGFFALQEKKSFLTKETTKSESAVSAHDQCGRE